jgi:predicted nucleic acid-binding protein
LRRRAASTEHDDESAISVITRAEVLAGFGAAPARKALRLLDAFPTLGIDQAAADLAAVLRRRLAGSCPAFQAASPSCTGSISSRATSATFLPVGTPS